MVTATATALATTTKDEGNVWVTWQLLAAAGEDGRWRQISSILCADFFNPLFCRSFTVVLYYDSDISLSIFLTIPSKRIHLNTHHLPKT
jgi:hypothetical protein